MADDRNQDGEGAPARTGGKRQEQSNEEDDCRQEQLERTCGSGNQIVDVVLGAQQTGHAGQRPCHRQDQDRGNHCLESLRDAAGEFLERHDAADHVEAERDDQRHDAAEYQTHGGVGVGECVDKALAGEESAGVDHADDAAEDENRDREYQINDLTIWIDRLVVGVAVRTGFGGEQIALARVCLMQLHRAVVQLEHGDEDDHQQGGQRVEVERNRAEEHRKAVDVRALRNGGGDSGGPARDRRDDAHRSSGRVDQVRQLGARDLMAVGDRTHDRTDGQAVEVVVDKDQDTQNHRGELCADAGLDVGGRPLTEGRRAADQIHQGDHDAQNDQEYEDADIPAVSQLVDHAAVLVEQHGVEHELQIAVGVQQCARDNADKQGGVDLLGDECQCDGDDRREQCAERRVDGRLVGLRVDRSGCVYRDADENRRNDDYRSQKHVVFLFHCHDFWFPLFFCEISSEKTTKHGPQSAHAFL